MQSTNYWQNQHVAQLIKEARLESVFSQTGAGTDIHGTSRIKVRYKTGLQGVVARDCNPSTWELGQEDQQFKTRPTTLSQRNKLHVNLSANRRNGTITWQSVLLF